MPHFKIIRFLLLLLLPSITEAQYGIIPIGSIEKLDSMTALDASLEMVDLAKQVPHAVIDLRYTSKNNFTGVRLYPKSTRQTYLRKPAAEALTAVAKELEHINLGIRIWDAYRPYHVTVKFWELIRDERYVANPSKGSGHNRGIAIDLTLYELSTGKEISMPTGFDDFSATAHHGQELKDEEKTRNRELLRSVMEKHGFLKFQTEWWHYSWPDASRFDVLDIPLAKLKKRKNAA